jgi:hypothetical protein
LFGRLRRGGCLGFLPSRRLFLFAYGVGLSLIS